MNLRFYTIEKDNVHLGTLWVKPNLGFLIARRIWKLQGIKLNFMWTMRQYERSFYRDVYCLTGLDFRIKE